jgi:hypothetical protein
MSNSGFVDKIRKHAFWKRILICILLIFLWYLIANWMLSGNNNPNKSAENFQGVWLLTPIYLGIVLTILFGKSK